jgi:hypothetical protein
VKRDEAIVESGAKKLRIVDCSTEISPPLCGAASAQTEAPPDALSSRAGERKRQAANRLAREQAAVEEAAQKRLRTIATEQEAMTPAARALARLRERVIAKQAHSG